ncbi:MAG: OmpA family protein [Bacteroidales bacterium]|nr:OmpA family protein [Bacteroidales bacterium]
MKRALMLILLLACIPYTLLSQNKILRKADTAFKYQRYNTAVTAYQKAFAKLKKSDRERQSYVLYQIAEAYRNSGQYSKAISQYKRAVKARYYVQDPSVYLQTARLQLSLGFFADAIENFDFYLEYIPDDTVAINGRAAGVIGMEAIEKPTRYEVENVRKINMRESEWSPRYVTDEENVIAFTSTRAGVTGKKIDEWSGQRFSDIFICKQDAKGEWSTPEKIDKNENISTKYSESDAVFIDNGNTSYFTFCSNEKKKDGRCIIKMSKFDGAEWSKPEDVIIGGDSVSDFIHPYITPDGNTLYFASNKAGGYGDLDIWKASGNGTSFGEPENLGACVNTKDKESYPFLRNDTLLYFSSLGHNSLGGFDIFSASLTDSGFCNVTHLDYPINTNSDDFGICFFSGQNKGFFSSNRAGGKGMDDIYSFYLPDLLFSIAGTVKNDESMQPISDAVVSLIGSDGMFVHTRTNSKGFYKFDNRQVKPSTTYSMTVEKKDFLEAEATETTVGLTQSKDFVRNFTLQPVPKGAVTLPEILYAVGKWDLQEQYQDSLIGLITLLEKNPRLIIELASHTDIRPIAIGNDSLSQLRAQAVVDYLIERGIHPERLIAKGYGARVPRMLAISVSGFDSGVVLNEEYISSLSDKNRQEQAHQLNRRTEFSVLRDDFIPSDGNKSVFASLGSNENLNKIPYTENPDKNPEFDVIINGVGLRAVLMEKAKTGVISTNACLRLLQLGKLGKNNFKNKEKAMNEDGEILAGQKVTLSDIRIEQFYLYEVELTTADELPADIVLNKAIMSLIGKYSVDKAAQEIVVEL